MRESGSAKKKTRMLVALIIGIGSELKEEIIESYETPEQDAKAVNLA